MKLIVSRIESGFSGSDHSAVKMDFLFAGHIPQAELAASITRAIESHHSLVSALKECRAVMAKHCLVTDPEAAVADVNARAALAQASLTP